MVAFLSFPDGEPFATGVSEYVYQPATPHDSFPRLILNVEIEGISSSAILDTGAPYAICTPTVARQIGLASQQALGKMRLIVRGVSMEGHLFRLVIRFVTLYGADMDVDATVFVLGPESEESWGALPSFIGLNGCLERMRFAVDPISDSFYFGPLE
jgi:hypothetical protein